MDEPVLAEKKGCSNALTLFTLLAMLTGGAVIALVLILTQQDDDDAAIARLCPRGGGQVRAPCPDGEVESTGPGEVFADRTDPVVAPVATTTPVVVTVAPAVVDTSSFAGHYVLAEGLD